MKGIVFTEFFSFVENEYDYDMVDFLIENTDLPSKGIYTAVGTYSHSEIVQLLICLSKKTNVSIDTYLVKFGEHLFDVFIKYYNAYLTQVSNSFDFLKSLDSYIHIEVLKLYPEATLPKFEFISNDGENIELIYTSERNMSSLAEGLLNKTFKHFNEPYNYKKVMNDPTGKNATFFISKA